MNTERQDEQFEAKIAAAIHEDYVRATQEARVPPPQIVWLRAEMRARDEAGRAAGRPIVIAQGVGATAFGALLVSAVNHVSFAAFPPIPLSVIGIVLGSWLVFAPVAIYLAFSRD